MGITLLDGGMGQELLKRSARKPTRLWATQFLLDTPELITQVHRDYLVAGADIITTNSYALHRDRLRHFGLEQRLTAFHLQACQLAANARDAHGRGLIAGAIGPTGASYRPELAPPAEEAAELFAEIARLQAPYVDLILCETMASVEQVRGALMGATTAGKPVWLAVTVTDDNGTKLRSGEPLTTLLPLLKEFEIDAFLVNCSPPEAVHQAIRMLENCDIPYGGYANGFVEISHDFMSEGATVDLLQKRSNLGPIEYADFSAGWIEHGATIIGGCCEVGPSHVRELARRFKRRDSNSHSGSTN